MGKSIKTSRSRYILISDFSLQANNRGTAALGYGSLEFLRNKGYLNNWQIVVDSVLVGRNPFRKSIFEKKIVQGKEITFCRIRANIYEYYIWMKTGWSLPFTSWGHFVRNISLVAALNGGDGFSDIYGEELYKSRLQFMHIAMKANVPLIIMPQTIGPFENPRIKEEARLIMQYAREVYVRDTKYVQELDKMGIKYKLTNDLSAFMKPEPWDIDIKPGSIGINISGLAYSNNFLDLAGQFSAYPELIKRIVRHFQQKGKTIYLIPHAYGYNNPEQNNDDYVSTCDFYESLEDKTNVVFVNEDLTSPRVKYVISRMAFFIGTRMHANFAAIFTDVPVFGLAYSFKFQGAFENNRIYNRTTLINDITESDINNIIQKIEFAYQEDVENKKK